LFNSSKSLLKGNEALISYLAASSQLRVSQRHNFDSSLRTSLSEIGASDVLETKLTPAGAYSAEIVRAGIQSTPDGQIEAGLSLALTRAQIFIHVVLPPALQRVWPALVSQIIIVMLGSAVCGQIATEELSYATNLIQSRNFRAFEAFIVSTLLYLFLAVGLRSVLNWVGPHLLFGRRHG
ncbi:MAG: ABC transporter permease subunit, partial [Betaproteobacteria bacterium]|nr:ABC transporter permease subunit [Betaproteobacteria bacterium]